MRYLVLVNNYNFFFGLDNDKYLIRNLFSNNNKIHRVLRKIWLKYNLPFKSIWFKKWIKTAKEVDVIIVFDSGNSHYVINYLHDKYPKKRLIFWYWNPQDRTIPITRIDRQKCEVWSFEPRDCKMYNLKYNTQFYFAENVKRSEYSISSPCVDVLFVGADKNRKTLLNNIAKSLNSLGFSYIFYLVRSSKNNTNNGKIKYKKPLSYPQVLSYIKKSGTIIDIVDNDLSGMTLRPLEALFWKKKLITNQKDILKMDFYNSSNIFIWGVDNKNRLFDFLTSEYDDTNGESFRNKYDFKQWIDRFEE